MWNGKLKLVSVCEYFITQDEEINFNKGYGKFFSNSNKEFDNILKTLGNNIKRIDLSKLDGMTNEYYNILKKVSK